MKSFLNSIPLYLVLYVIVIIAAMFILGIGLYPDQLVILLAIPVALAGRISSFLKAWSPFLFLLFSYEFLRGLIGVSDPRVHFLTMPHFDQAVCGVIPTVWLQQHLFDPLSLHWYDYLLTGVYFLHFVAPVIFALVLWYKNKDWFGRFTAGFLTLSYGALLTYLLYPAAPPWLASDKGLIPHVTKILDQTMKAFPQGLHLSIPSVYYSFDANLVAAVPSLHAAYPTIILLFAVRFFKARGLVVLPYTLAVYLMVVYFGEHYVSDVILGIIYATAAFLTVELVWPKIVPLVKERFNFKLHFSFLK